jgi:hypothetical protein
MFHQISVNGEQLIPVLNGGALIASKSSPGAWHAVRLDRCDCPGFTYRGTCRHIRALASYLNVDEPVSIDDGDSPSATAHGARCGHGRRVSGPLL